MDKRFYRQLELYYLSFCSQSILSLEVLATADGFGKLPGFHWLELDSSAQVVQPRPKQKTKHSSQIAPNSLRQSDWQIICNSSQSQSRKSFFLPTWLISYRVTCVWLLLVSKIHVKLNSNDICIQLKDIYFCLSAVCITENLFSGLLPLLYWKTAILRDKSYCKAQSCQLE